MEHTAFSIAQVAYFIAWFRATPIAPFEQIPQIEHHFIARLMDMGARGLMIPDVRTVNETQLVVLKRIKDQLFCGKLRQI